MARDASSRYPRRSHRAFLAHEKCPVRHHGSGPDHLNNFQQPSTSWRRPCPRLPPPWTHPAPGSDGPHSIGRPSAVLVGVGAGCSPGLCGDRPTRAREVRDPADLRQRLAVPPGHRRGARGGSGRTRRPVHRAVRAPRGGHRAGLPTRPGLPGLRRSSHPPPQRPGPTPAPRPRSAPKRCPVNPAALGWALSPLDFRAHAVIEHDNHPIGVLIACCGHLLPMVVTIDPTPPGAPCPACTLAIDPESPHPRGDTR